MNPLNVRLRRLLKHMARHPVNILAHVPPVFAPFSAEKKQDKDLAAIKTIPCRGAENAETKVVDHCVPRDSA